MNNVLQDSATRSSKRTKPRSPRRTSSRLERFDRSVQPVEPRSHAIETAGKRYPNPAKPTRSQRIGGRTHPPCLGRRDIKPPLQFRLHRISEDVPNGLLTTLGDARDYTLG